MKRYSKMSGGRTEFTDYIIVVPTKQDKKDLMEAFEHFHYASKANADFVTVNQLIHEYGEHSENIVVDKKLYAELYNKRTPNKQIVFD